MDAEIGYSRIILEKAGYQRIRIQGGILVLRLRDAQAATLNAWHEDCLRLMETWQPGKRLRYLHDIRAAEKITPLALDRVTGVLRHMRRVSISEGRGAILMSSAPLAGLLASFLRRKHYPNWQIRFFTSEPDALHWLRD